MDKRSPALICAEEEETVLMFRGVGTVIIPGIEHMIVLKMVFSAAVRIRGIDGFFVGEQLVIFLFFGYNVPEEQIDMTGGVLLFDIGFHPGLIAIIEDDDLFGGLQMFSPFAPEQRAAGDAQDVEQLVD